MQENGGYSGDPSQESEKKLPLIERVRTARATAFSRNYDAEVNPQAYEAHIEGLYKRTAQARAVAEVIKRYVSPREDKERLKALDIAAGTGMISRALEEEGFDVTATDLSQNALHYLQERSPNITIVQANMNESLPLDPNSFDAVTSVWANRFITDSDAFLGEVHRVLRPEGIFVWPVFAFERAFWKKKNGLRQHTNSRTLLEDARNAGFGEVGIETMSFREALHRKIPLHAVPRYIVARK